MERKNSFKQRKNRTRKLGGFFASGHCTSALGRCLIYGREGDGYNTRKGKKSACLFAGS